MVKELIMKDIYGKPRSSYKSGSYCHICREFSLPTGSKRMNLPCKV